MKSLILSRRELDFMLFEWLRVQDRTSQPRFAEHSRETFTAVLDLAEQLATRHFATHNQRSDAHEPQLIDGTVQLIPEIKTALDAFGRSGLLASTFDAEHGGMQLPQTVAKAAMLWFQAANTATSAYPFLTIANANLLIAHGSSELVQRWVPPMVEGRFFGTMCLSETQAGSSLADITTLASPAGDGTFRLAGRKMWISAGDHELSENIVHLVLARTPGAPAGVRGISLFVVPKYLLADDGSIGERNDVVVAGLNHKMGYRGTVNTVLHFGEGAHRPGGRDGAVGYLVGELNQGLAYMFHMMDEARIGVGLGATALGYTGYLHSLDYARTRLQGRAAGAGSGQGPQLPIIEHSDVRHMLLAQRAWVEGSLALGLYCANLVDNVRAGSLDAQTVRIQQAMLSVLTPLAKSWPSQWCLAANELAIQIHGGYGYTRDFPVEQFYRDNRLNLIHEGTNGIQGLDLLGRRIVAEKGLGMAALRHGVAIVADGAIAERPEFADAARRLHAAFTRLGEITVMLSGTADRAVGLANSSIYLNAFGTCVVGWLWLAQLLEVPRETSEAYYRGKVAAGNYFLRYELPKVTAMFDLLESLDTTTLDVESDWL